MEWIQFLIVVMTIGSFLWIARSESRSDIRHMDNKIDSMRNQGDPLRDKRLPQPFMRHRKE